MPHRTFHHSLWAVLQTCRFFARYFNEKKADRSQLIRNPLNSNKTVYRQFFLLTSHVHLQFNLIKDFYDIVWILLPTYMQYTNTVAYFLTVSKVKVHHLDLGMANTLFIFFHFHLSFLAVSSAEERKWLHLKKVIIWRLKQNVFFFLKIAINMRIYLYFLTTESATGAWRVVVKYYISFYIRFQEMTEWLNKVIRTKEILFL